MNRRTLLKSAALATVGGVLAACGSSGGASSPKAANPGASVPMPTYVPPVKPKPTLPGNELGLMDVYDAFPMDGPKTVQRVVGDGGEFNVLVMTYGQPPPPLSANAYWQLLNKELNLRIKPLVVPYADFQTKFPALVAGGDLPDVVSVPLGMNVSRLPQLAEAQFTDLSEYLSGDAVKKYPNLAGIQKAGWLNGYVNGRIYGVPRSDPVYTVQIYTKTDVIEKAGANPQPKNLAELQELAKAVTNAKAGVYAFGGSISDVMQMTFGVPNKWSKDAKGTFVSAYEHPAFVPAISAMADMYKAGYFHPDTAAMSTGAGKVQRDALFRSGKLAMVMDGTRSVGIVADDRDVVFGMMVPFGKDGGKGVHWTGTGAYAMTMLKKTSDKTKIDRFLGVMDYVSAPFGSQESFVINYGAKDSDYTVKDGVAILTTRGQREQDLGFAYIAGGPQVLCDPQGAPGVDKANYEWQRQVVPMLLDNPAQHLYSETFNTKGAALEQQMLDAVIAVFLGRSPASSLTDAVRQWKRTGGDKMAKEYGEAAA